MKAGLNQVQGEINGNNFIVHQSPVLPEHPTLREQIFKVAFYDANGGVLSIK
jgi:hypothetical protein